MSKIVEIQPEYIYVTIPAEYICVYHRILAMLADYGEEMLKDCKAGCTNKNSGVIECFNMFNSAVAARKLGKDKLAELLIKYIKNKINQIYRGKDNSTSFVFPVDENGQLKAFVSCGERPKFEINADDGKLYEHKFNNGFIEHFHLGEEDNSKDSTNTNQSIKKEGLEVILVPSYELIDGEEHPCAEISIYFDGNKVDINDTIYQYYFDYVPVKRFNDISNITTGIHNFQVVVTHKGVTKIANENLQYKLIKE